VLARQIERIDAVACADRPVALRFQQVVEELHVELVVFHDQHGLGHCARSGDPRWARNRSPGPKFASLPRSLSGMMLNKLMMIHYGMANGCPHLSAIPSPALRPNRLPFKPLRSWQRNPRDSAGSLR